MDRPPSRKVLGSFVHDEYGRKYIIMEWTIEMKMILIKMIKVILIKISMVINIAMKLIMLMILERNKKKERIIMLLMIKVKRRSIC